jgi:hypothetical protein
MRKELSNNGKKNTHTQICFVDYLIPPSQAQWQRPSRFCELCGLITHARELMNIVECSLLEHCWVLSLRSCSHLVSNQTICLNTGLGLANPNPKQLVDGRVRRLTVSPSQFEVCPKPRQQASLGRLRALLLVWKNKGRTTSGNCWPFFRNT